jgi:mRNA interferase HicA
MNSKELKKRLASQGCTFRNQEGWLWPPDRAARRTQVGIAMHGGGKELGTGLINAIKKQLGLK